MFEDRLHEIGFTKKESRIYLELLKLGPQAVSILAKKAESNRTTAYSILKSLEKKGVVSSYVNKGMKFFVANDPNCLIGYVDQKCKTFDYYRGEILRLVPQYRSLAGKYSFKKPVVRYFEGIEGIKHVVADFFSTDKKLMAILSFDERWRDSELWNFIIGHMLESIIKHDKVKLRTIAPDTKEVRAFLNSEVKEYFELEDVLFVPSGRFNKIFENQIGVYDDKVAIVRLEKGEEYGIIIENKDIADMQREILKMAWGTENNIKKICMKLKILYEDENVLVVDKPAGIIVHPGESKKDYGVTVVDLISDKLDKDFRSGERPGIVHRLDKDTSGVLIIAKNKMACTSLKKQFKDRKVCKKYIALVNGKLQYPEGIIDSPIARATGGGNKMRVSSVADGREAVTRYLLKDIYKFDKNFPACLVEVEPKTGRTHQIRVHMAAIGHPVTGDPFYGNRKVNKFFEHSFGLKRQFLHSCEIKFKLPGKGGKMITVTSKLPEELTEVLKKLTLS